METPKTIRAENLGTAIAEVTAGKGYLWWHLLALPIIAAALAVGLLQLGKSAEVTGHEMARGAYYGLGLLVHLGGFVCYAGMCASTVAAIGYPIGYSVHHEVFRRYALWCIRDPSGAVHYEVKKWGERRTVNGGIALVFRIGGRRHTGRIETNIPHQDRAINNAWRFELVEIRGGTAIVRMRREAEALELPVTDALEFMDRFVRQTQAYGAHIHDIVGTIIRRYRELHATDRLLRDALDAMDSTIRSIRDSKGRFGKSKEAAGMRIALMRAALDILRQAPLEDPRLTAYADELGDAGARPLPTTAEAEGATNAP